MEQTVFNPAQKRILHMMSFVNTPKELNALENVLSEYFAKKVDEEMDKLCAIFDFNLYKWLSIFGSF